MGGSKPLRERHDGWTEERLLLFLARLGETGDVTAACEAVGMSTTNAYRTRKRCLKFADRWDLALAERRPILEQAAFQRAVYGVDEPVVRGGAVVATRRRYSDRLLRLLIERDDRRRGEGPGAGQEAWRAPWRQPPRPIEEVRASILAKLAAVREHDDREERARGIEYADRMRAEGKCP